MNTGLMFSSATDLWSTPQDLFDKLNAEFCFSFDVCATIGNTKCEKYFSPHINSLTHPWVEVATRFGMPLNFWMNPPYGREIGKWIKKAYEESQLGATVVCLLPARTDTAWFWDYIQGKAEIRFIRGRLKFGDSKNSAPFPSMIVVFRPVVTP